MPTEGGGGGTGVFGTESLRLREGRPGASQTGFQLYRDPAGSPYRTSHLVMVNCTSTRLSPGI